MASFLWLGLPLTGLAHLGYEDDTACGVEAFGTSGPDRITHAATTAAPPIQHCAICHLQRASNGAQAAPPVNTAVAIDWTNVSRPEATRLIAGNTQDRQPARAPPSSHLS
jgi:hypothetical protein